MYYSVDPNSAISFLTFMTVSFSSELVTNVSLISRLSLSLLLVNNKYSTDCVGSLTSCNKARRPAVLVEAIVAVFYVKFL